MTRSTRPMNVLFAAMAGVGAFYGAVQVSGRLSGHADAHDMIVEPVVRPARPVAPVAPASASKPASAIVPPEMLPALGDRARSIPAKAGDAFPNLSWLPPAPPPPAPAAVVAPPPPPPPAPPPLPTLPYRFVGLLDDAQAGKPRVFLALGEKLLVASPGDLLEGGFRLESIGSQELVFVHLQQNLTLRLSVAGG